MSRHKKQPVRPMNLCGQCMGPQSEQQANPGDRELLRESGGDMLEVSTEAVAAKARGVPVMPPLAERQRHKLVHLPLRNWCIFLRDLLSVRGKSQASARKERS